MAVQISPFFTPFFSVGEGGENARTDVMLVQYMLFKLLLRSGNHFRPRPNRSPHSNMLSMQIGGNVDFDSQALFPVNGRFHPDLPGWISSFQSSCNHQGLGPLRVDGLVTSGSVGWGPRTVHRNRWLTIHALNYLLHERSAGLYAQLPYLEDMPSELRQDLTRYSLHSLH